MNAVLRLPEAQEPSLADSFAADIPLSLAVSAYGGISMSPEKRGASTQAGYCRELEEIYNTLKSHATKGGTLAQLEEEFSRLRAGYRSHYRVWLSSKSRCISSFITGPSNFPTRRAQKRNRIEHGRLEALIDFKSRAMKAAIRNLRPDLRPIMAGDDDAVERLEAEIRRLEESQALMKAANVAIRKHKKEGLQAQAVALVELGFADDQIPELLTPKFGRGQGFASYSLSNNNANIRNKRLRLEQIKRNKAKPTITVEGSKGVTLEDCPPENRVRLRFPGKPPYKIRESLKPTFRWARSIGAWQAYRNSCSIELAQRTAQAVACFPVSDVGLAAWMQDNPTYALHATEDGYHWLVDEAKVSL